MSLTVALHLIKSLSASEKRCFNRNTLNKSDSCEYFQLFEIINKRGSDEPAIKKAFGKLFPTASIDNTAAYLVRVLTDSLIQTRMQKDNSFQLFQRLMRVKVLQERSLPEHGHKELMKIRKFAGENQQPLIEYLTYRYELDQISSNGFKNISDSYLIEAQMKARDLLKNLNHVQDHHSLFELMKHRLLHTGQILSDEDRKKLSDLMLSEMAMNIGRVKSSFNTNRLHLLFQSYFFTNMGDFHTALKTYRELTALFEQNLALLDHPPLDYLSTLDGIISSLRVLKHYDEIPYYLEKLKLLDQSVFPEYFQFQVRKSLLSGKLSGLLAKGLYIDGVACLAHTDPRVISAYNVINEEKQLEVEFYCSLAYFGSGDFKKAHRIINTAKVNNKKHAFLLICKALRLLDLLIYYKKNEADFIEYGIRSYLRFFGKKPSLLKTEVLVLKYLQLKPNQKGRLIPALQAGKLLTLVKQINTNKYEQQLTRYFDFPLWIEEEISKKTSAF